MHLSPKAAHSLSNDGKKRRTSPGCKAKLDPLHPQGSAGFVGPDADEISAPFTLRRLKVSSSSAVRTSVKAVGDVQTDLQRFSRLTRLPPGSSDVVFVRPTASYVLQLRLVFKCRLIFRIK